MWGSLRDVDLALSVDQSVWLVPTACTGTATDCSRRATLKIVADGPMAALVREMAAQTCGPFLTCEYEAASTRMATCSKDVLGAQNAPLSRCRLRVRTRSAAQFLAERIEQLTY
jgi:hypothetical protein